MAEFANPRFVGPATYGVKMQFELQSLLLGSTRWLARRSAFSSWPACVAPKPLTP